MSACHSLNACFYFEEDDSPGSLTTRLYYDVSTNAEDSRLPLPHGKKWLRMWKNNRATEPARINRRIKSTSMASTGQKAKLREKTKVSRVMGQSAAEQLLLYVPDVYGSAHTRVENLKVR